MKVYNQKKMILISGFVGAGKTTIAQNLANYLQQSDVCIQSISAFPNISYVVLKAISMLLYGHKVTQAHESLGVHPATLIVKRFYKLPKSLVFIITLIEVLSIQFAFLRMMFSCRRSKIIVVDEGPINMVANYLEVLDRDAKYLFYVLCRLLKHLQQQFDVVFIFLITNQNTLINRWIKRNRPLPTSLVDLYHHFQYIKLLTYSKTLFECAGFSIISFDTSNSDPESIARSIIKVSLEDIVL
jgi:deoxyadenosine/deoxycytidine kinase